MAKRRAKKWAAWLLGMPAGLWLLFLGLDRAFPLPPSPDWSQTVVARDGTLMGAYLTRDDQWRMQTRLEEVPDELVQALIAKEDRYYYRHWGINPLAIFRAFGANLTQGRRVSGASTITMQVARMMEPKSRTYGAKLREGFRALQLEWHHSKTEILEIYLSRLPYGGNVQGVKAAAFRYFGRPPQQLSLGESILLTVIPNRPNSLRPDLHPGAARNARDLWLKRFRDQEIFPASDLRSALREPVPQQRRPLPRIAPQLCNRLRQIPQNRFRPTITTTLIPEIQAHHQQLLKTHVLRHRASDVTNGALLIVDNTNGEVLAYCGSADFNDKAAQGEVDAIQAIRSPGSTLKPLIYGMAFETGYLTPATRIPDIPTRIHNYQPENYLRNFQGEVRADRSLQQSLNVPAVRTLHTLGIPPFVDRLESAGFKHLAPYGQDLGLSIALGGCGATLEELVRLYHSLARAGEKLPLRYHLDSTATPAFQRPLLLDSGAAWIISDILSGMERPDVPQDLLQNTDLPRIAWKTGTSFGRRDAWAVGYTPRYTVGVWMGNMDGRSAPQLSGARMAVPLLVDVFNELEKGKPRRWFQRPISVQERRVCSHTGHLPGTMCEAREADWGIRGVTAAKQCDRLKTIWTDASGSVQYCPECLPESGFQEVVMSVYTAELAGWRQEKGDPTAVPPPHFAGCRGIFSGAGPEITSLEEGDTYYLEKGEQLGLRATPQPDVGWHYWYLNGEFAGMGRAGEMYFAAPPRGAVEVVCMDDKGRKENARVTMKSLDEAFSIAIP